jgi:hypothetical protein
VVRTSRLDTVSRTYFVLADLGPAEREAARELAFEDLDGEMAKAFPRDAPHLDDAYDNFRRCASAMLRQTAGLDPVPWEDALVTFLELVSGREVRWWLAGSTALAVRGLAVAPRDIDVIVDGPGARALGELLAPHVVEPVVHNDGWIAEWWGRAFPGARVEWVGDVRPIVDDPDPVDYGSAAAAQLDHVTWYGHVIRLPPLHLQLAVTRRRGLADRVRLIEAAIGTRTSER